jgi:hypothetical protein
MGLLGTAALFALACSEPSAGNVGGGMDGGGSLGLGLTWTSRVFVQELWEESGVSLVGINQRSEAVTLELFEFVCGQSVEVSDACSVGNQLATWDVPANEARVLDANAFVSAPGTVFALRANGMSLGLIEAPRPPRAAVLPMVSNQRLNGGFLEAVQVETESASAGENLSATLSLSSPGELTLTSAPPAAESVQFARLVGAYSDDVEVVETATGFRVVLPGDTSEEQPVRVRLDLAPPDDFSGGPLLGLDGGHYCFEGALPNCDRGVGITRGLLVP